MKRKHQLRTKSEWRQCLADPRTTDLRGTAVFDALYKQPRLLHFFLLPPLRAGLAILIGGNVAKSLPQTREWDGMKMAPEFKAASNTVLSVSANQEDCASLERILNSDLTVIGSATAASALSVLRETPVPIVIYDCDSSLGSWIDMLTQVSLLPDPPLFIVTSRLADERLWSEALNLGAWDVLAKPFDAYEVIRIVSVAGQHWRDRHGVYFNRAKQRKSVDGTGLLAATGT